MGKVVVPELMGRVSISRKITSVSCNGVHGVAPHVWHALYIGSVALLYSSCLMLYELACPRLILPVYHLAFAIVSSILLFVSKLIP